MTTTLDVVAASLAAYRTGAAAYTARNVDKAADLHRRYVNLLPANAHVLDAGCGPGRDLARFAAAGHRPVGVDATPEFVTTASRRAPCVRGDLRALPFAGRTFDGVWASASLVHLPDRDAAIALSELRRVSRSGMPVYVSVKRDGVTGWRNDDIGRRWFQTWTALRLAEVATAVGLWVIRVDAGPVWLDLWAVTP